MRQIHVLSGVRDLRVMNLAVVRTWSQTSSGVLENCLVLEITRLLAEPLFYDPHMRKGHLDIPSPSICSLDLDNQLIKGKGRISEGFR